MTEKAGPYISYYTGVPIYPFGYGLSYTNFEYSNMKISSENADANGNLTFSADIKNTGTTSGKEVAQLYISHPANRFNYTCINA